MRPRSGLTFNIFSIDGVTADTVNRVASPRPVNVIGVSRKAPMDAMVCGDSAQARYVLFSIVPGMRPSRPPRVSLTRIKPSACAHGSGRSSTPYATLNNVVTAPTPSAIVRIVIAA